MNDILEELAGLVIAIFIMIGISYGFDVLVNYLVKRQMSNLQNAPNKKEWKRAAKVFGVKVKELKKMDKDEIKRRFRKIVMGKHPDQGGDEEEFKNIYSAYEFAYAAA